MKLSQLAQALVVVFAALAVFQFVRTAADAERRRHCTPLCALQPHYAGQERRMPDFELPRLAGGTFRSQEHRGKTLILNFWSKTCPPCLEELPSVAELAQKLAAHPDVALVTLCTDESMDDARATLASVLGSDRVPFEVLLDPERSVVTDRFGTKLFPETWFIDPRGVVRARVDGARNWSDALVVDFARGLAFPRGCELTFRGGRPTGPLAGLCTDL